MKKQVLSSQNIRILLKTLKNRKGGQNSMAVLVLCSDLALVREWVASNPDANAWFYGKGLPRQVKGLEGRILPATLTLKEAKAYGDFSETVELPPKPAKKASKKGAGKSGE